LEPSVYFSFFDFNGVFFFFLFLVVGWIFYFFVFSILGGWMDSMKWEGEISSEDMDETMETKKWGLEWGRWWIGGEG
jgi:hypothetical protein